MRTIMFDFEKIHKNKKYAFLDGLLCGLLIWFYTSLIRRNVDEPFFPWITRIKKKFI